MKTEDVIEQFERRRRRVVAQSQTGSMIALAVLGLLVGAFFFLGNSPAAPQTEEPFFPGQAPGPDDLPGQVLFTATCSPCHGVTASGNEAAGIPPLNSAGDAWMLSESEILTTILEGTPRMPPNQALLDRSEALQIIEFLQALWTVEQREAYQANQ